MRKLKYHRILLKLSGELLGPKGRGIDSNKLIEVATIIQSAYDLGAEIAIVVGGGNWWRKRDNSKNIKEVTSDYIGMLGTVLNGLALCDMLNKKKVKTVVQSFLVSVPGVMAFNAKKAVSELKNKKVVIFAAGTGKPFVTTDTASAQRARDIQADVIFKVGEVDGVYTADPDKNKKAKKFRQITFREAEKRGLKIFDRNAYSICAKAGVPVIVFKWSKANLLKALSGENPGTIIL